MNAAAVQHFDTLLFAVLPYAMLVLLVVASIQRYRSRSFGLSSFSSQFLESRHHFWGTVPFHYGLVVVLLGHVAAFVAPGVVLAWNGEPLRLHVIEIVGLSFALLALVGLLNLIWRRRRSPRLARVTGIADRIVLFVLAVQIGSGIGVAVFHGWGSSWFATSMSPYLWSLVGLNPDIGYVTPLPWLVKVHVVGGFVLIGLVPFTRLVHVLVVPVSYLWRKRQIVRWYRDRRRIRTPASS